MRNAVIRRRSNKGLLGKSSSTLVARRPANMTVMTPENKTGLSRWYHEQGCRRDGRPIPLPIEVHYHHTNVEKTNWGDIVGITGGAFAAVAMGLMVLPSLVTALAFAIPLMVLSSLVVAVAIAKMRGLSLSSILFAS